MSELYICKNYASNSRNIPERTLNTIKKTMVRKIPTPERIIPALETLGKENFLRLKMPVAMPTILKSTVMYQVFHRQISEEITESVPNIKERNGIMTSKKLIE